MLTINNVCSMMPEEILKELTNTYGKYFSLPNGVESAEDMTRAGALLGETMNAYSFVSQLASYATINARYAKNRCPSKPKASGNAEAMALYTSLKEESELMALRRDTLKDFAKLLEMQHRAISRMITVRIEANKELAMSESRIGR